MALLMVCLAMFLGSAAAATQDSSTQQNSQPYSRYYGVDLGYQSDAKFTLLPMNDVMFTQNVLSEVSSKSKIDCGRKCVGAEGCVMFTFQRSEKSASGRCRVYGQVHNQTGDQEASPEARSYVLNMKDGSACGRRHSGYFMKSGFCVQVINESVSYQNATQTCLQLDGGHLVYTKTTDDLRVMIDIMKEYDGSYGGSASMNAAPVDSISYSCRGLWYTKSGWQRNRTPAFQFDCTGLHGFESRL